MFCLRPSTVGRRGPFCPRGYVRQSEDRLCEPQFRSITGTLNRDFPAPSGQPPGGPPTHPTGGPFSAHLQPWSGGAKDFPWGMAPKVGSGIAGVLLHFLEGRISRNFRRLAPPQTDFTVIAAPASRGTGVAEEVPLSFGPPPNGGTTAPAGCSSSRARPIRPARARWCSSPAGP